MKPSNSSNQNICSKMFTDLNIRFPYSSIKNCCKTEDEVVSLHDIKKYGLIETPGYLAKKADMLFLNELPKDACRSCIETEPHSLFRSWNTWKNTFTDEQKHELYKSDNLHTFEFVLSSACDLKCIYCGSKDSTSWAKELGEDTNSVDEDWSNTVEHTLFEYFKQKEYTQDSYWFFFSGGEPTYNPKTLHYIREIKKHVPNDKLNLVISTNINTKEKIFNRYLKEIQEDRNIKWTFDCSMDGIKEHCEAVRTGIVWDRAISNLKKLVLEPNVTIRISPTTNIYSLPQTFEFVSFFYNFLRKEYKKNRKKDASCLSDLFNNNLAMEPEMSILYIPKHYASYFDDAIAFCKEKGLHNPAKHLTNMKALVGTKIEHAEPDAIKQKFNYFKLKRSEYNWDELFPHVCNIVNELQDLK